MLAKRFKKVTTEDGEVKFLPCFYKEDFVGEDIVKMKYADLPKNSLMARKVCYKDMMLALKNTKPSIEFWEVTDMYEFENEYPAASLMD